MPTTNAALSNKKSSIRSPRQSCRKTWSLLPAILLPMLLIVATPALADFVDGEVFQAKQPDGEVLQVRVWGDEFHRVAETLAGFTVTRDPNSSEICYARLSDDESQLVSTGVRAGSAARDALGLAKHLRIDPKVRAEIIRSTRERFAAEDRAFLAKAGIEPGAKSAPSSGAVKALLLLVDFSDDPATIPAAEFDDFCNLTGYSGFGNNGSVNDYFLDVSDGNLDYTNYVVPQYYRAAQPKSYYNDETVEFGPRARELILEALNDLEASGYDFSQHDSNGDGLIDGINLFYAGGRPPVWATGIWPHSWTVEFFADGVQSYKYQMTDISDEITLRTFCHENGHMICYWPDLYDYGYDSKGVGQFCLMCYGTSNTNPGEPSAPMKHYSGWDTSVSLTSSQFDLAATAGLNEFFVIPHPTLATEYYMIENRQQTGRDAGLPDAGIAIWHVDELGDNDFQEMTTELHYEVSLVQADGNFDLEGNINYGDVTDLWKSPSHTECTPATAPNTNWWDGTGSGLAVLDISASGSTMTFDLALATGTNVAPSASFTATPISGFTPLVVQFNDTSLAGDTAITSWLWDFGDGATSTEIDPSHTYITAGSFTVSLTVANYLGTDQEFIASPIEVTDEPSIVLIDAVQEYDGVSGLPMSPYDGQVVTIAGNIYVDGGTYNAGGHYIADASGGISFYDALAPVNLGDYVEVTGTVISYQGEIQLSATSYENIAPGVVPSPLVLTPDEAVADYENVGSLATVTGVVQNLTTSSFELAGAVEFLTIYIDNTTGIDLSYVANGDNYAATGPLVVYNGLIEIKPRTQADLVENPGGDSPPIVAGIDCTTPGTGPEVHHWAPMTDDDITFSAEITDDFGLTSATLWYRTTDGQTPGTWMSAPMSASTGDTWSVVVAGPHTQPQIDFYVEAIDTGIQTVNHPGNAPVGFHSVGVGMTLIYDVQYSELDSPTSESAFVGRSVTVEGIVTAGPGQTGSAAKFLIQEALVDPNTDSYAFGGITVYGNGATFTDVIYPGDQVRIGGVIDEYYELTEILPHETNAVNLIAFGQDLPPASAVRTRTMADNDPEDVYGRRGEAWESVWIKTVPSAVVMDTTGFGSWLISDTGVRADSVTVDPLVSLTYEPTIGEITTVEGFLNYSFGKYSIVPVDDLGIEIIGITPVDDTLPTLSGPQGFQQIAPNPFNPQTTISFRVLHDNLVQLNIYNLRGQKVRTLIQESLPANEYDLTWNGTDDSGAVVSSGTYFARLRIGTESTQVRKLMILK